MKTLPLLGNGRASVPGCLPRVRRAAAAATTALVLVLSSTAAAADPVRIITSGSVWTGNYDTGFNPHGTTFEFRVSQWLEPLVNCQPCVPGAALDLSTTLTVRDWAAGQATIDGRSYDPVFFDGSFDFSAGSVIVPAMAPGQSGPDAQGLSFRFTSFTFRGTLAGFADASLTGSPLFSTNLIGRGIVRAAFSNYPPETGIRVLQLDYHFDDAAPTPEPGSLLLFGSGAAWMAAQWRRRRRGRLV